MLFITTAKAEECNDPATNELSEAACALYNKPSLAHLNDVDAWDRKILDSILREVSPKRADELRAEVTSYIIDCQKKYKRDDEDLSCSVEDAMRETSVNDLILDVDWKDYDSVEGHARAIARELELDDSFRFKITEKQANVYARKNNSTAVELGLGKFDNWLKERGYRFVLWDSGEDSYRGFVVKPSNVFLLTDLCAEADDAKRKAKNPLWWSSYIHFDFLWSDDVRICASLTYMEEIMQRVQAEKDLKKP